MVDFTGVQGAAANNIVWDDLRAGLTLVTITDGEATTGECGECLVPKRDLAALAPVFPSSRART